MLPRASVLRRSASRIEKHYLLVQIYSDKFATAADFQSRRPTPRVVAAKHAGVDQKHFVAKARPYAATLLHCVAYHNVCRLVTLQDLADLRRSFFFAPLVITAKPHRTVNPHTEPIFMLQELLDLCLALIVGGDTRLELSADLRPKHTVDFLQSEEWQNQIFILQILFRGIECLDFVVDPIIYCVKLRLGQLRRNSSVQKDDSINFGHCGMSPQPFTVFSLWT